MKKRLIALLLAVCLSVSMLVFPASAAGNANTAVQFAVTLGAMESGQTAALNAVVTRGAFARMLVSYSAYREGAASQGSLGTLYTDLPGTSPWAPYVRIAVQQGWMNGYTDGSFRPDNAVTLEEAVTAVLKLMGYKMTELSGAFPAAQLNKASEIGLRSQLDRKQGEVMNYEDCAILLYNALTSNNSSGTAYGSSLGFTVSNGQVDASTVLLKSMKGPFVADENTQLSFVPTSFYCNDKTVGSYTLSKYDVYYYSESLQTLWVYTRRAAGRITAVSPSASAPTSVTVAGSSYTLSSSAVASKVSSLNGGGVGQVVTLLLGMNNEVADVLTGDAVNNVFYGVVQTAARSLVEENGADVQQTVAVTCTDGITRTVNIDKNLNYPTSWLVQITVDENGENVKSLTGRSTSGAINDTATTLGSYALAADVEILDTTSEGVAGTVRPSRLSGVTLSSSDVRFFTTNEKGQIDRLILNDVTGDLWEYGVLDDIKNLAANITTIIKSSGSASSSASSSSGSSSASSSSSGSSSGSSSSGASSPDSSLITEVSSVLMPTTSEILWGVITGDILSTAWNKLTNNTGSLLSIGFRQIAQITGTPLKQIFGFIGGGATYVCYVKGSPTTYTTSIKYPVLAGGIAVQKEYSGTVKSMVQLMPMKIDRVGAASVMASDGTYYDMDDNAQVYLWFKGQYYPTKLASVNSEDYYLTGWYDNFGCTAGKKVRVIIAVKKD